MAQYDGSVRVNTKLDTTGFDRGSDKLKQATESLNRKFESVGKELEKAVAQYQKALSSGSQKDIQRFAVELEQAKNAAAKFRQDMEAFKTQKFQTDDYKFIQQNIDAAQKALDRLLDRQAKMDATGVDQNSRAYQSLQYDIEQATRKLETYKADMAALLASGDMGKFTGGQTEQFRKFSDAMNQNESALRQMSGILPNVRSGIAGIAAAAAKAGLNLLKMVGSTILTSLKWLAKRAAEAAVNLAKLAARSIANGIKRLGSWLSSAAKSMTLFGKSTRSSNKGLGKGLMTVLKYTLGIRSLYFLVNKLRKAIKEGFENLAQYSPKTNKAISELLSSLTKLKNSVAAAFAPIVNIAAPALANFVNLLSSATEKVAGFFAAMTGQKTMIRAKEVQEDYAASLDKTSKSAEETKKQLAGFDELNILSEDKSKDTENAASKMFEEVSVSDESETLADQIKKAWEDADFSGIGEIIGKKLKKALDDIPWNSIKTQAKKLSKSLATLLNGVFETPGLFTSVGRTIAEAINTAFDFVDSFAWNFHWGSLGDAIMDVLEGIADNINWNTINSAFQGVATGLADLINAIFSRRAAFEKIGRTLGEMLNTVISAGLTLVNRIDFNQIGDTIAAGLNSAVSTIRWDRIGELLGGALGGALQTLYSVAKNFNWVQFGESLASGVNELVTALTKRTEGMDWGSVGRSIGEGISAMIKKVNWNDLGKLLAGFFNDVLGFIGGVISGFEWREVAKSLGSFINSAISNIDWKELGSILSNAVKGMLGFINAAIEEIDWQQVGNSVADFIAGIDWSGIADALFEGIGASLGSLAAFLWGLIEDAWQSVVDWWHDVAFEDGKFTIAGLLDGIVSALVNIGAWIHDHIFQPFIDGFRNAFGISSPSTVMAEQGVYIIEGLKQGLLNAIADIKSWVKSKIIDPILNAFSEAKATVQMGVELIKKGWESVKSWVEDVKQWGADLKEKAVALAKNGWNTVKSWVETASQWGSDLIGKGVSLAKSGWDSVKGWVETAVQWGGDLVGKAVSLAKNGWSTVKSWTETAAQWGGDLIGKGVLLAKSGWSTVKSFIESSAQWGGELASKAVTLVKSGWDTVKGWIENTAQWGGIPQKAVSLAKSGWSTIKEWIESSAQWGGNLKEKAVTLAKSGWDTVKSWVETWAQWGSDLSEKAVKLGRSGWSTVKTWLEASAQWGADVGAKAIKLAGSGWTTVKSWIESSSVSGADAVKNVTANVTSWKDSLKNKIIDGFSATVSSISNNIASNSKNLGTGFSATISSVAASLTTGVKNLGSGFSATIDKFTDSIPTYQKKLSGFSAGITGTYRKEGGTLSGGIWHSLPQFANGGIIRHIAQYAGGTLRAGSMFVAGEAGPEVVGHINGRTEVLNKSQIASAIYSAVLAGMETAVNALGRYITNHMTICTNAVINALAYTRGPSTVTLSVPDAALLQRLIALAEVPYTVPAYATGTVMPYEVVAELRRQTSELKEAIRDAAEEIIQANTSAISNHGMALTQAIESIQVGGGQSYSPEYIAQYTIDEINRRTQMMGRSPLLT